MTTLRQDFDDYEEEEELRDAWLQRAKEVRDKDLDSAIQRACKHDYKAKMVIRWYIAELKDQLSELERAGFEFKEEEWTRRVSAVAIAKDALQEENLILREHNVRQFNEICELRARLVEIVSRHDEKK